MNADSYFAKGCGRCARFDTPECSTRLWLPGLLDLRRLCLAAGLTEEVKWSHPCYTVQGRNIAILGAFRGDFCITFINAELFEDDAGRLTKRGEATQVANVMSFTANDQVQEEAPLISRYLDKAMAAARSGAKPQRRAPEVVLPEELVEALDADPALAEAFAALTPGRQRGYCLALASAKQAETRRRRIEGFRPRILAGQGLHD